MDDSELLGVTCTAGDCLEGAVVVGHVTLEVSPFVGATSDERRHTFTLPLCIGHAHLLRAGATLVDFSSGL